MRNEVRYVFDTNVIISALLFENSKPAQALRYALANGEVLLSIDLLEELNEVLGRERFNRYLTSEEREEFLEALIEQAVLVEITENVQECRDPKDDKVLELALNGEAQYIIRASMASKRTPVDGLTRLEKDGRANLNPISGATRLFQQALSKY